MTDSLLVAKMNSRQSFENSHHSNLELDPAFGGSQRRLETIPAICLAESLSRPALRCLLRVEEGFSALPGGRVPREDGCQTLSDCLVQSRNCASQDLFVY